MDKNQCKPIYDYEYISENLDNVELFVEVMSNKDFIIKNFNTKFMIIANLNPISSVNDVSGRIKYKIPANEYSNVSDIYNYIDNINVIANKVYLSSADKCNEDENDENENMLKWSLEEVENYQLEEYENIDEYSDLNEKIYKNYKKLYIN